MKERYIGFESTNTNKIIENFYILTSLICFIPSSLSETAPKPKMSLVSAKLAESTWKSASATAPTAISCADDFKGWPPLLLVTATHFNYICTVVGSNKIHPWCHYYYYYSTIERLLFDSYDMIWSNHRNELLYL